MSRLDSISLAFSWSGSSSSSASSSRERERHAPRNAPWVRRVYNRLSQVESCHAIHQPVHPATPGALPAGHPANTQARSNGGWGNVPGRNPHAHAPEPEPMELETQAPAAPPPPLDLPNVPVMVTDDFNFATGQPGQLDGAGGLPWDAASAASNAAANTMDVARRAGAHSAYASPPGQTNQMHGSRTGTGLQAHGGPSSIPMSLNDEYDTTNPLEKLQGLWVAPYGEWERAGCLLSYALPMRALAATSLKYPHFAVSDRRFASPLPDTHSPLPIPYPTLGSHGLEILHLKHVDGPAGSNMPRSGSSGQLRAHERVLTGTAASMPPGPFSVDIPSGPSTVTRVACPLAPPRLEGMKVVGDANVPASKLSFVVDSSTEFGESGCTVH